MRGAPGRLRTLHRKCLRERERHRPGLTVMGRNKKKKRDGDNRRPRLVLSFDEEKRR